jgi:hypothetical protein
MNAELREDSELRAGVIQVREHVRYVSREFAARTRHIRHDATSIALDASVHMLLSDIDARLSDILAGSNNER